MTDKQIVVMVKEKLNDIIRHDDPSQGGRMLSDVKELLVEVEREEWYEEKAQEVENAR